MLKLTIEECHALILMLGESLRQLDKDLRQGIYDDCESDFIRAYGSTKLLQIKIAEEARRLHEGASAENIHP